MTKVEIEACREHYGFPVTLSDKDIEMLCNVSEYLAYYRFRQACLHFGREVMKTLPSFLRRK